MNDLLNQSAKRFDEFMKGEGDGPTDLKAFLRSEQIAFAISIVEDIGHWTDRNSLEKYMNLKRELYALKDTPPAHS